MGAPHYPTVTAPGGWSGSPRPWLRRHPHCTFPSDQRLDFIQGWLLHATWSLCKQNLRNRAREHRTFFFLFLKRLAIYSQTNSLRNDEIDYSLLVSVSFTILLWNRIVSRIKDRPCLNVKTITGGCARSFRPSDRVKRFLGSKLQETTFYYAHFTCKQTGPKHVINTRETTNCWNNN